MASWGHVSYPARVDAVDEDFLLAQRSRAGAGEHIECCLGHVGVGVATALFADRKLAFQRRNIDDVTPTGILLGRGERRPQSAAKDEWSDRIGGHGVKKLPGGDLPTGGAGRRVKLAFPRVLRFWGTSPSLRDHELASERSKGCSDSSSFPAGKSYTKKAAKG